MGQSGSRQTDSSPDTDARRINRRSTILRPASALFSPSEPSESRRRPRSIALLPSYDARPAASGPLHNAETLLAPRRSRFHRARDSIFHRHGLPHLGATRPDSPLESPTRSPATSTSSVPRLPHMHLGSELNLDPSLSTTDDEDQYEPARRDSTRSSHRPMSSIADRISSLTPDRGFRSLVRRRRSPARPVEDQTAMLSRMLSVAAAATAASLMGNNAEEAVNNLRNTATGIDGDDGTFDRFLQALRSGRLNAALNPSNAIDRPDDAAETDQGNGSLQFFRVFRFGNAQSRSNNGNTSRPSSSRSLGPSPGEERQEDGGEGRLVPVLMIGIRSLNGDNDHGAEIGDAMPSFLDALTSFPPLNMNTPQPSSNSLMRQARSGVRISQRRRASMGGLGLFSAPGSRRRPHVSETPRPRSELDASIDASPPEPHPPPTTPSSPPLSNLSSGTSTPTRRASIGSIGGVSSSSPRREHHHRSARTALESTAEEPVGSPRPTRARRLSESDFMRYGSGSSRRNGVVEPDHSPADREGNRSWIIYVLGGSYPENHPILTTPSLFTDSPTYEDMLLLSSMLGPAKPPVATADDVANAGGLFTAADGEEGLHLLSADMTEAFPVPEGDRCHICLCEYSHAEGVRRLNKCQHMFHQECIDQWLTTGRNCCPLCRGQGVDEAAAEPSSSGEGVAAVPVSPAVI